MGSFLLVLPSAQAVVFSQGDLVLDDCDFSNSSAEVLVDATQHTVIRNAVLGDENCKYDLSAQHAFDSFGCLPYGTRQPGSHASLLRRSTESPKRCLQQENGPFFGACIGFETFSIRSLKRIFSEQTATACAGRALAFALFENILFGIQLGLFTVHVVDSSDSWRLVTCF